jgi:predicted thioesterase
LTKGAHNDWEMKSLKIGDQVSFKLEGQTFEGFIDKEYQNSFMITFKSDDAEIVDKYHDRVIINKKQVKLIKAAPETETTEDDEQAD